MRYLLALAALLFSYQIAFAQMVNPVLVGPTINKGLVNGNGIQIGNAVGCSTSAAQGSSCPTTITWPVPFVDTNYQMFCFCNSTFNTAAVTSYGTQTTTTAVAYTTNFTAAAANCAQVTCLGIHN